MTIEVMEGDYIEARIWDKLYECLVFIDDEEPYLPLMVYAFDRETGDVITQHIDREAVTRHLLTHEIVALKLMGVCWDEAI